MIFQIIHGLLVPTSKEVKRVEGKRIQKRYTIEDSKQAFALTGQSINEVDQKIKMKMEEKLAAKETLQPLIIIITDHSGEPKEFFVYFDNFFLHCQPWNVRLKFI